MGHDGRGEERHQAGGSEAPVDPTEDPGLDPLPDGTSAHETLAQGGFENLDGVRGLARTLLGEPPTLDAAEVAQRAGVPEEQAKRLWRALGFPGQQGEKAFTEADAVALRTIAGMISSGNLDLDSATDLTRAMGQTMARLADWGVGTILHRVEALERTDRATGSMAGSARRLADELGQPFEELLVYVWRRHLSATVSRLEALTGNEEDLHTTQVTVGFADIVSFTALSNRLESGRIGDVVELFESRCADVVASHRGRVVKSIGDSVLFTTDSPTSAIEIAEGIISVIGRDQRMPDVRVGLATGSVVMRLGDVFGPPVNMAARLTAVARRNRVIVDAATAEALPREDFETRALPARPVRGFGIVEPVAVRRH